MVRILIDGVLLNSERYSQSEARAIVSRYRALFPSCKFRIIPA